MEMTLKWQLSSTENRQMLPAYTVMTPMCHFVGMMTVKQGLLKIFLFQTSSERNKLMRNQIHINYLFVESKWTYLLKQQICVRLTPKILFIPSKNAGLSIAVTCLRLYAEWRHHPVLYLVFHGNCSTEYLTRPLGNIVKDKQNFFCTSQSGWPLCVCIRVLACACIVQAPLQCRLHRPRELDLKELTLRVQVQGCPCHRWSCTKDTVADGWCKTMAKVCVCMCVFKTADLLDVFFWFLKIIFYNKYKLLKMYP